MNTVLFHNKNFSVLFLIMATCYGCFVHIYSCMMLVLSLSMPSLHVCARTCLSLFAVTSICFESYDACKPVVWSLPVAHSDEWRFPVDHSDGPKCICIVI
jgi:hypothetical protein